MVPGGQWGPVAVGRDLIHGWRQGAAVSRRPSVGGLGVGLLVAAQALEVVVVLLLTPVSQHMDWKPPLRLRPCTYSSNPSLFSSPHSSSPLPWRVVVWVDSSRVPAGDIGVREVSQVWLVTVVAISKSWQRRRRRVRGRSSEGGAPGLLRRRRAVPVARPRDVAVVRRTSEID